MIEELYITDISASVVGPGATNQYITQTVTLTVYTNPHKIVAAGIAISAFVSRFYSAYATIKSVNIQNYGELELSAFSPSVTWAGLESITFELQVGSGYHSVSNAATIFIAQSS